MERPVLALLSALLLSPAAWGQDPVGDEFQTNTYTENNQMFPAASADASGNFVVVWQSLAFSHLDTSSYSIQGQRYASDGGAVSEEFQVNSYTTYGQFSPAVAASSTSGAFVVAWSTDFSIGSDYYNAVHARRFASDGSPVGTDFQVNAYTPGYQDRPAVAMEPDGDFVVVWQSGGSNGSDTDGDSVQGQRFSSDGSLAGSDFQINTYTTGHQNFTKVAMAPSGDFLVVWRRFESAGGLTSSIQGQLFASDGSPNGGEFQVNSYTTGLQHVPAVAVDDQGDFVVVWQSDGSGGSDSDGYSIQGQRYASSGLPMGPQFQVNSYTTGEQKRPSVATDTGQFGRAFVVVWDSYGSSGLDTDQESVQARWFTSDGSPLAGQFEVNTYTTVEQYRSAVILVPESEDFLVVWESGGSSSSDASGNSIQGQLVSGPIPVDLAVSKTESIDPVTVGCGAGAGALTYVVTVTNNGPADASGVELSEELTIPSGVAIDSITPSAGSYIGGASGTWTLGSLAASTSETLTVTLTIGLSAAGGNDVISDTAVVAAVNETDTDSGNDSVTESTSVTVGLFCDGFESGDTSAWFVIP